MAILENDEDMKVVPDSFRQGEGGDKAEDEINQYFRHKRNGNIQTAKNLGEKLAALVIAYQINLDRLGIPADIGIPTSPEEQPQLDQMARMLSVYIAETAAKQRSPDSILCQMVIASLGDEVSARYPSFYSQMSECRAYTVFKLCGSRRQGVERAVGEAFAQLTGHKEDEAYIALGTAILEEMSSSCSHAFSATQYDSIL